MQDYGKPLWQPAHRWPTFGICIIINPIRQIWFLLNLSVPPKSWDTTEKAPTANQRKWHFPSAVKEKRDSRNLLRAHTGCTMLSRTCGMLQKGAQNNFTPFKHSGLNSWPARHAIHPPQAVELCQLSWELGFACQPIQQWLHLTCSTEQAFVFRRKQWSLSVLTQPINSPGSKNRIKCP